MIAIVDQRISLSIKNALSRLGFSVIPLPAFSRLSAPVASHPDMLMLPFEDRIFVHAIYYEEARNTIDEIIALSNRTLTLVEGEVLPEYPNDVSLNLFCIGKSMIGKQNVIPQTILEHAQEKGYRIINTNQGYAKCSSVLLGDRAVITADSAIERCIKNLGINVLRISEGSVALPPYPYGFLGGASGCFGNTVYFCGDLLGHPDAERIKAFCQATGFSTYSLSDEPLADHGSIFFL